MNNMEFHDCEPLISFDEITEFKSKPSFVRAQSVESGYVSASPGGEVDDPCYLDFWQQPGDDRNLDDSIRREKHPSDNLWSENTDTAADDVEAFPYEYLLNFNFKNVVFCDKSDELIMKCNENNIDVNTNDLCVYVNNESVSCSSSPIQSDVTSVASFSDHLEDVQKESASNFFIELINENLNLTLPEKSKNETLRQFDEDLQNRLECIDVINENEEGQEKLVSSSDLNLPGSREETQLLLATYEKFLTDLDQNENSHSFSGSYLNLPVNVLRNGGKVFDSQVSVPDHVDNTKASDLNSNVFKTRSNTSASSTQTKSPEEYREDKDSTSSSVGSGTEAKKSNESLADESVKSKESPDESEAVQEQKVSDAVYVPTGKTDSYFMPKLNW